jgi:hypothetical protein
MGTQDFTCSASPEQKSELLSSPSGSNSSDTNPGTRLRERMSANSADDILELVTRSRMLELQIGLTQASDDNDIMCSLDSCSHRAGQERDKN